MSILSGYKKFKKYIKTSSGFQLQSLCIAVSDGLCPEICCSSSIYIYFVQIYRPA